MLKTTENVSSYIKKVFIDTNLKVTLFGAWDIVCFLDKFKNMCPYLSAQKNSFSIQLICRNSKNIKAFDTLNQLELGQLICIYTPTRLINKLLTLRFSTQGDDARV